MNARQNMTPPNFPLFQSDTQRSQTYHEPRFNGPPQINRSSGYPEQPSRRASAPYGDPGAPSSPWLSPPNRQSSMSFPTPHLSAVDMSRHPQSEPINSRLPTLPEESGMSRVFPHHQGRSTITYPRPGFYSDSQSFQSYQPLQNPYDQSVPFSPLRPGVIHAEPALLSPTSDTSSNELSRVPHGQSDGMNELGLDLARCSMLVSAVRDMEIIKKIFCGWYEQLHVDHTSSHGLHRKQSMEQILLLKIEQLKVDATSSFSKSEMIVKKYRDFIYTVDRHFSEIERSHGGGHLQSTSELEELGSEITTLSSEITTCVENMREILYELVKKIESTRDEAQKKATRSKLLHWLENSLKVLNGVFGIGSAVTQLAPPVGTIASVCLGGAAVLTAATAELSKKIRKDFYDETAFDTALRHLREDIPQALKSAEFALTSFQASHKVLNLDMAIRGGMWVSASDASAARRTWREAGHHLKLEDVPPIMAKKVARGFTL
ncbi:hypothetical protein M0805_004175 [Coniferiporia weirii]|nr:hypothetical protein M0805_004175 [Coniferiporia weirii]